MEIMIVAWYFAIWGLSGTNFAVIGPFGTEEDCNEIRLSIVAETKGANTVSKCWKGTS